MVTFLQYCKGTLLHVDCRLADMDMLNLCSLTVFWDLTCHSCQQSPGDLLANGATVGAPRDLKKLRPLSPPPPHPVLFSLTLLPLSSSLRALQGITILFFLFLSHNSLTLLFSHSLSLILFLFFIFSLDLWWLVDFWGAEL